MTRRCGFVGAARALPAATVRSNPHPIGTRS